MENLIEMPDKSKIFYKQFGQGENLFMLHGNDGDMRYFDGQVEFFKKYYHVYLIDFRDHGKSTNTKNKLSFKMMAQDLKEVFDKLSIKQAHILGFSDGANLALVFNKYYKDRVGKLILNAPNARFEGLKDPLKILIKIQNFILDIIPIFKRSKRVKSLLMKDIPIGIRDLRNIESEVMIIVGSLDVIRLSHIRKISKNIRKSKLYIVKGAGHKLSRKYTDLFNKLVFDFLKGA